MIEHSPNWTSHVQQRRITARRSSVHGKELFVLRPIAAGERLIEYTGELTSWRRASTRQRVEAGHTFVFGLSDGQVIDGSRSGNSARYLNHACAPNFEAVESGNRVFIHALIDIAPGCELFIDYALAIDSKPTDEIRQQYACRCGLAGCRQTMLSASDG